MKHLLLSLSFFTTTLTAQKSDMELVKNYLAYTLWANEQMTHWMSEASDEIWTKEIESSFTSIESTTKHLWSAEYGWLSFLKHLPWESTPQVGSKMEMLQAWEKTTLDFVRYGIFLLETPATAVWKLRDQPVEVEEVLLHVCNHATYHRGQLITMGRQAGLAHPPRTDYIYFIRLDQEEKQRLWERITTE